MVQFLSINFFFWISSIFVGFFKSSRFFFVSLCIMIEEVGILYGSCQAGLIEGFRMSHDTPKFVPETGAEEEGNMHFCDFLLCRT